MQSKLGHLKGFLFTETIYLQYDRLPFSSMLSNLDWSTYGFQYKQLMFFNFDEF